MSSSVPLTFLGTGGFHATAGYWSSFLIGERVLVETSPSVLRNLRVAGKQLADIDVIFISHFHADHTFGWPFVLFTSYRERRTSDLWVVGPPKIGEFMEHMLVAGALDHVVGHARSSPDAFKLHYVEVTERPQEVAGVRFRAVKVDHDPVLECYGYLIEMGGKTIGYSGDTTLCPGLREIAAGADALVMECNAHHSTSPVHLTFDDVRAIRKENPELPIVITHRSHDVDDGGLPNVRVPEDFETVML
ncbi:MAG: MBL fold metallo-hydrolase [Chloroflexota bacterium]